MKRRTKIILWIFGLLAILQIMAFVVLVYFNYSDVKKVKFGATFSAEQARRLGLNPFEVLWSALDDMQMRYFRLSAHWNIIEHNKGRFDFSDLDWQIKMLEEKGAETIVAIGRRAPRWPECHDPLWLKGLNEEEIQAEQLKMLEVVIRRYKGKEVIKAWQVENEPFLTIFGNCPKLNPDFFKKEIELVRKLDQSRPIILTASGELSTLANVASLADMVGISIYRTTWDKIIGLFYYPLTPQYYKHKAKAVALLGKRVFVSELQAEPWERQPLSEMPLIEQKELMNAQKLKKSVEFARHAGFDEVYLWGVEWWYWLKGQGDDSLWNVVKEMIDKYK